MKNIKKINDINFDGKVAIVRVDFNVPLDKKFNITDTTRIDLGINSIKHVLDNGGKCIVMSHLGRPKGVDTAFSLLPVSKNPFNVFLFFCAIYIFYLNSHIIV